MPRDQGTEARKDRDILEAPPLVTGRGLVLVPGIGMGYGYATWCDVWVLLLAGLIITRNVLEVEAALAAVLPVAGGQEGQRTEVADGHVHEVALVKKGESHVPAAGPGSILLQHSIPRHHLNASDGMFYICCQVSFS